MEIEKCLITLAPSVHSLVTRKKWIFLTTVAAWLSPGVVPLVLYKGRILKGSIQVHAYPIKAPNEISSVSLFKASFFETRR